MRHALRREVAAAMGTGRAARAYAHPKRLVSLVIVDETTPVHLHRLTCFGALVVDIIGGDPHFALYHRSTSRGAERRSLLAGLRAMSEDRHVVLASSHPFERFADHCHVLLDGLAFLEIIEVDDSIEPAGLTLLNARERLMDGVASAFDLQVGGRGNAADRARYAGVRAQVGWLAYVSSSFDERRVRSLLAAYRAWQALERARPLPF
ncbi:hypothetical protein [Qipengyuania sediminis]|uniref:hypothetical protein n=1 Tax=Qipengyuania sediminis TaxID=1532023 RepID=UPI00140451DD|nr:hypothetical protein [Qipengyuania sediminis]